MYIRLLLYIYTVANTRVSYPVSDTMCFRKKCKETKMLVLANILQDRLLGILNSISILIELLHIQRPSGM
jgi:hypothetical protein